MHEHDLNFLIEEAKTGDKAALETLVQQVQNQVYNLAVRMLWHPNDAEDATQEILIQMVTRLSTFRGESKLSTWVYRIAANHLLNTRKKKQNEQVTFAEFGEDLDRGLSDVQQTKADAMEQKLLVEEVKIGCTQAMLQCLDQTSRLVYILGEIFEMNSLEGSEILEIRAEAFRKRLSRARTQIRAFMQKKCGIVNPQNACRCAKRIDYAVKTGRVAPGNLNFASHPKNEEQKKILRQIHEIHEVGRVVALYRTHPDYQAPESVIQIFKDLFQSGQLQA